ncbi:hypothetical protein I5Q40_11130 [Serratia marcescens]|nr:hypothetical protein [Serratia marcescens]
MDKLSELSKPVAWKFKNADDGDRVSLERKANIYGRHDFQPLYSQEYVSALLADNEALKIRAGQQQSVAANNLEMFRKADERAETLLAELEAKGKHIAELEARLATPVRLPTEHELHQVSCSECAGNCLELVESTVRAAGFTVEGNEQ